MLMFIRHEILCQHLRCSSAIRAWFGTEIFRYPHRICDYLLSCPTAEIRIVFMKIIVFLAHFSIEDPPGESLFLCEKTKVHLMIFNFYFQ